MTERKEIASSIRLLMYAQEKPRADLATLLGVSKARASSLARGSADLTVEQLFKVADWLGSTPSLLRAGYEVTPK